MKALSFRSRQIGKVAFANEPISLEMAWWQLRITPEGAVPASPDDPWLQTIGIPGARAWCEGYWGRQIARRTFEIQVDGFPLLGSGIVLPIDPVVSVESITYIDSQDVVQTLDASTYQLDPFGNGSILLSASSGVWPIDIVPISSVLIVVKSGFDSPTTDTAVNPLPDNVRSALLLMLGHLYANREATSAMNALLRIPIGATELLDIDRMRLGMA